MTLLGSRDRGQAEERLDRRAHVAPRDLTERIEAVWAHVAEARANEPRRRSLALVWGTAGMAIAAGLVALWVQGVPEEAAPPPVAQPLNAVEGTRLQNGARESNLVLPDGSRVVAGAQADVELEVLRPDRAAIRLHRGTAHFDVTHDPRRPFSVKVGNVLLQVLGTRFEVERAEESRDGARHSFVRVAVQEGVVSVTQGPSVRRLLAGEQLTIEETQQTRTPAPTGRGGTSEGPGTDEALRPEMRGHASPERRPKTAPKPETDEAARLFQRASAARIAGQHAEAAALYETFLKRHANDARAPLVAFELGRTHMDVLEDPSAAAQTLERALRLGPHSPFAEDALARLVRLHEALGRSGACRRAREEYLRRFPEGSLAQDVRRRCRDLQ